MKRQKKPNKIKKHVEKHEAYEAYDASEACEKCGESDADLETMPCCGKLICWDFCLYEMPTKCPFCGESISFVVNL